MNPGKLLACVQMILCLIIALGYLYAKDYRRAFYWICAAGITFTVTFE